MVALVRKWPLKVLHQIAYLEGGLELAFFKTVHSNQSDNSVQHAAVLQGLKKRKFYLAKHRSFGITLKSKNHNAKNKHLGLISSCHSKLVLWYSGHICRLDCMHHI